MKNLIKITAIAILATWLLSFTPGRKLTPFAFVNDYDTLVYWAAQKGGSSGLLIDTLMGDRKSRLAALRFDEKNFLVDTLGVTPARSFSLLHRNERIALVGIWEIDNERIAVNINYLKKEKFYSGYVIKRKDLEALLVKKQ